MKLAAWIVIAWMAGGSQPVYAEDKNNGPIPVFAEIAPGIYRGGQPSEEGFDYLKNRGIKTIVNFRHEIPYIRWGEKMAGERGMEYVSIPWKVYGPNPDPAVLDDFFGIVDDPAKRPVFVHCRRGAERTGVIAALYYMKYEGLDSNEAYRKAMEGYPVRWFWKPFIKQRFEYFKKKLEEA